MVEPNMRGDPTSPVRWTTNSTRKLAGELAWQAASRTRCRPTSIGGVRTPGQCQDSRGRSIHPTVMPSSAHQRLGQGAYGRRLSGDHGGHQEEGVGRPIQEWGS
ncbi:hypothetical protein [Streptomyces sp. NPDC048508]|uniref:hypothetical protein n=1 Tax=Streptomyces sp. NPDC048508 TaxID=3365561 RepID=UPI003722A148